MQDIILYSEDMESVKRWLDTKGQSIGWIKENVYDNAEIWAYSAYPGTDNILHIVIPNTIIKNKVCAYYIESISLALSSIAKSQNISKNEAYREIILNGIHLDDFFVGECNGKKCMTLQWSSRTSFGEYKLYKINQRQQWVAEENGLEQGKYRCLKELMRQLVDEAIYK